MAALHEVSTARQLIVSVRTMIVECCSFSPLYGKPTSTKLVGEKLARTLPTVNSMHFFATLKPHSMLSSEAKADYSIILGLKSAASSGRLLETGDNAAIDQDKHNKCNVIYMSACIRIAGGSRAQVVPSFQPTKAMSNLLFVASIK